jgi:hypothetical protein
MTLPFWHRTSAGLHVADRAIHWVELRRSPRRTVVVRVEREAVDADGVEAALRRLAARVRPAGKRLATALDLADVWHVLWRPPAGRRPTDEPAGVHDALACSLGDPDALAGLVVRWTHLGDRTERPWVIIAATRREAVDRHKEWLRAAGFGGAAVGSLPAVLGHAYSFDPAFVAGRATVALRASGTVALLRYENGILSGLEDGAGDLHGDPEVEVRIGETGPTEAPLPVPPLRPLTGHERLGPAAAPAAALALARLFPALPAVDFQDPDAARAADEAVERYDALRLILTLGALLLAVLGASRWMESRLAARRLGAEARVATMAPLRDSLQALQAYLVAEQERYARAAVLLTERARVTGRLERIGRAVPASAWLESLRWEADSGGVSFTLVGRALADTSVAAFMERLEDADPGRQVTLREDFRVPGDGEGRRFEIQVVQP